MLTQFETINQGLAPASINKIPITKMKKTGFQGMNLNCKYSINRVEFTLTEFTTQHNWLLVTLEISSSC